MMRDRERSNRRSVSRVRIRTALSIERLESRAVLAGLINLGDSLLEIPPAMEESTPAIVAPVAIPTIEVPVVEPTPFPSELTIADAVRPEVGDPVVGFQEDRGNASNEGPVGDENADPECSDDSFGREEECPSVRPEFGTSHDGSRDSLLYVAAGQSDGTIDWDVDYDRPLIALYDKPLFDGKLKSSMLVGTPTAKSIEPEMAFRYFTDSRDANRDQWMTLKSEPLSHYATGDTFVAFELMEAYSHDDADARQSDVQRTSPRRAAFRADLPLAESMKDVDRITGANPTVIAEAEAAIAIAQQIVEDADAARDVNALGPAVATVVESTADSNVAFTAPASSCDSARPGRQPAFSLTGSLRFGLLGVASIVISMRASSSNSLRRRTPEDPPSCEDAERNT